MCWTDTGSDTWAWNPQQQDDWVRRHLIKLNSNAWKEEYLNSNSIWGACDLELLGHKYICSWWQHLQWLFFTKYLSHWHIWSCARGNLNLQISGEYCGQYQKSSSVGLLCQLLLFIDLLSGLPVDFFCCTVQNLLTSFLETGKKSKLIITAAPWYKQLLRGGRQLGSGHHYSCGGDVFAETEIRFFEYCPGMSIRPQ